MNIKISYIGGGSKAWARKFMQDLALAPDLSGEVSLYDIDMEAAERNRIIGEKIQEMPEALSRFRYTVAKTLEESLKGADFVIMSILPVMMLRGARESGDVEPEWKCGWYSAGCVQTLLIVLFCGAAVYAIFDLLGMLPKAW